MRCSIESSVDDSSDEDDFFLRASEPSLAAIWDKPDDDIYAELLESDTDPELTLNDLLAGVTKKNRHPAVDFGGPIGKERL